MYPCFVDEVSWVWFVCEKNHVEHSVSSKQLSSIWTHTTSSSNTLAPGCVSKTECTARLICWRPSCVRCRKDRNSGGEEEGERGAWGRNSLYFTVRVHCFHQNDGLCSDASSFAVPLTAKDKDYNAVSIKHKRFSKEWWTDVESNPSPSDWACFPS